jgi:amino acid transporter
MQNVSRRGALSRAIGSTARVLFTTLIFTAGGMGLGLLLGIISLVGYGLIAGVQPDMRNAYRHVAIPVAIAIGCAAFAGALVLELRTRRTRTSRP